MTRVYRTDAGVQLRQMRKDANGDLIVDATVARVGVYEYPQPDGSVRRELVRPEELFDPRSVATLRGRPVTDQHPGVMFANADVPPPSYGVVGKVRQDGRYLVATSRVAAGTLARKVETSQQRETSPGYFMDLNETPGVWVHPEFAPEPGERYDAIQGLREYDHLAVVPVGRCAGSCGGEECRCEIRTDAGPGAAANGDPMSTQKKPPAARNDAPSKMAMELCLKAYPDDAKGALTAYAALMAEMGGEAPAEPVIDAEKPPGEMPPGLAAKPEEKMDAGKAPAASSAVVEQKARIDSLEATVKAQSAQLEAMGKQANKDRATSEVAGLVAEWRGALGARYDADGKTAANVRRDALKAFYPAEAEDLDKADDRTLEIRCGLARRYDPSVQAVLAGMAAGAPVVHLDGAGLSGGGEDPIIVSERKLRDRWKNGQA